MKKAVEVCVSVCILAALSSCVTIRDFLQTMEPKNVPSGPTAASRSAPGAQGPTASAAASSAPSPRASGPAPLPVSAASATSAAPARPLPGNPEDLSIDSAAFLVRRHAQGTSPGARVLTAALGMIARGTVVVGGCWDWVNKVYTDAGFPTDRRQTVFSGPEAGPYADPTLIKPGDWLYFENLTFGGIGHSAIFVDWIDFDARSALTIGYMGQNQVAPGKYREYDVTKTFGIFRGRD